MSLNIKNRAAVEQIRKLAALKGVSLTRAVQVAVQREIDNEEKQRQGERNGDFADWLMNISKETAPLVNDGRTSRELMDELYDQETGLPK